MLADLLITTEYFVYRTSILTLCHVFIPPIIIFPFPVFTFVLFVLSERDQQSNFTSPRMQLCLLSQKHDSSASVLPWLSGCMPAYTLMSSRVQTSLRLRLKKLTSIFSTIVPHYFLGCTRKMGQICVIFLGLE